MSVLFCHFIMDQCVLNLLKLVYLNLEEIIDFHKREGI